jgi:hypothetical protein
VIVESFSKVIKEFNSCESGLARLEAQLLCNKVLEQHLTNLAQWQSETQDRQIVLEDAFGKSRDQLNYSETGTAKAHGGERWVPQSDDNNRINAV